MDIMESKETKLLLDDCLKTDDLGAKAEKEFY